MTSVTPPSFLTGAEAAVQPHSSLEEVDPTWRTQFQLLVTEGGPSQLVSSLQYLPKLFRVKLYYIFKLDYLINRCFPLIRMCELKCFQQPGSVAIISKIHKAMEQL